MKVEDILDIQEFEKLSLGFLDFLPYGICVLDHKAKVIFINRRQEQLSSVTRNDVVGKCLLDSPALKANGLDTAIKTVLKTGVSWKGPEVEAHYRDHAVLKTELYKDEIIAIREKDQIVGAIILSIPSPHQNQLDEQLQKIDTELDALFQVFQDGLMVIDEHFNILRINKVHAAFFGKNALLSIGHKCYEYLRNELTICQNCPVQKSLKTMDPVQTEFNLSDNDSDDRTIQISTYPIKQRNDKPSKIIVYSRDITFSIKQEEQIKQFGELVRREVSHRTEQIRMSTVLHNILLDNLNELVAVVSADFILLKSNRIFQEVFQVSEDETTGKHISKIPTAFFNATLQEAMRDAIKNNTVIERETVYENGSINARWLYSKITPANLSDGSKIVIIITKDITEDKHQKQRYAFKEKMENIGLLARKIAHEINNPLEAILNRICLLEMEISKQIENKKIHAELEVIQNQINQISEITSSLLTFTKTSTEEFQPVDIGKILNNAIIVADIESSRSDIIVETQISPTLPMVLGDKVDLERCFVNIFNNAVDAIIDKGTITITAELDFSSNPIKVEIKDTGVGIPEDKLDKIIDPFYTTKKIARRVGLGLSISYGIILDHHGSIEVRSDQNQGTEVIILIPELSDERK